jgi:pimeloyl-ACP methyl ester carboxylesterase
MVLLLGANLQGRAVELRYHEIRSVDDVPLNVVEAGNPNAQPIIFLHGFSQTHLVWRRQFDDAELRKHYRLIALDLRGHGGSGKPWARESYAGHLPWAEDIRAVVETLGLNRPVLVGWSFGGYVALDYLREYGAEALTGIVLTGSHAGLIDRLPGGATIISSDLDKLIADGRAFAGLMTATPAPSEILDSMVFSYVMLPIYARRAMRDKRLDNTDLTDRLTLPLAVILGEEDDSLPAELIATAISGNPQATLQRYPGVGHSPFIEATARFNADLHRFVQQGVAQASARADEVTTRVPVPQVVFDYLRAVNAGDSAAAVAGFAEDGEMHLLQSRIARGHAQLLEVERFHEIARPHLQPQGLRASKSRDGEIVVGFDANIERSAVFAAMGLAQVKTMALSEAFVVRDGKIRLARQPAFVEACDRAMNAAMLSAITWLDEGSDPRQSLLMPQGKIRMDSSTVGAWIFALRDWRAATAWSPNRNDLELCGGGS